MAKRLRVVVVGCGSISGAWLQPATADKDVDIVALVDLRREAAIKRAADFGLTGAIVSTDDLADVLRQTTPDVVFNCTVPEAHLPVTLTALRHGCHVFVEKPLAESMRNARRMVAAATRAGKVLAVMQNRRAHPQIRALARFLRQGRLGALTAIECDFHIGAHFGGFRDHLRHVLLLDMAIHHFDMARLITGADATAVYCHEWNPRGSWYDHDAAAVAIFEMTGGLVFTYCGSWCTEGLNTTWQGSWRIAGERGSVTWDGGENLRAQVRIGRTGFIRKCRDVAIPVPASTRPSGHAGMIAEWLHCLRTGRTPETIASDNIKSLAMVFGAIASAQAGRRVPVRI